MSRYEILESGSVVNTIVASREYVENNYSEYRLLAELPPRNFADSPAQIARNWRDGELLATDWISQTPDHPQRSAYITYRTALRNWPSTGDFPATKPVLG